MISKRVKGNNTFSAYLQPLNLSHILVLAFLLRLVFFLTVFNSFSQKYGWEGDDNYDEIALNVLNGEGYRVHPETPPNTVRPPLYTLFLIIVFAVVGSERWKVFTAQALLQTLVCYLVYRLGKRFTNSESAAKLAALLFALYPQSMLYSSMYMTETLFSFLIIVSVWFYLDVSETHSASRSMLLGVVLGLAALTRPVALLLFVPIVLLYFLRAKRSADNLRWVSRNVILIILFTGAAISPWTVRNYAVTGKFIPVSSRGAHFLYSNTITGSEEERADQIEKFGKADNSDPEGRDSTYLAMAVSNILEKPHLFIVNTIRTMLDFWYRGHSSAISLFNGVTNFLLLSLAVFGIVMYRHRHGEIVTVLIVYVLYFNVCYGLLHAISRYSYPVIPFVLIYASYYITGKSEDSLNATT